MTRIGLAAGPDHGLKAGDPRRRSPVRAFRLVKFSIAKHGAEEAFRLQ
jgi:hypothetical protein